MNLISWSRKALIQQFLLLNSLRHNNRLVNKYGFLYSTVPPRSYSTVPPRSYSSPRTTRKAYHHFTLRQSTQNLLKSFYSSRLSISSSQLQTCVIQISKNSDLKIKDHRWQSLYMTIEKYHEDFNLQSKISIMQALGRVRQNNSLYITLYKSVVANFQHLDLNQLAILIWSMVKVQQHDKATVLAIYKRFYQALQNQQQNIKLITGRQQISKEQVNLRHINEEDQQQHLEKQYMMAEGNFTLLIWALQRNSLIDQKLILALFKNVFTDQSCQNLQNVRIQNLCLILYCMCQLGFQKYRIAQLITNRIMKLWQHIQKINVLTTVLLIDSFAIFINGKQKYLFKYSKDLETQKITSKEQSIKKERKFVLFLIQAIFLKNQKISKSQNSKGKQDNTHPVMRPLSTKFSSQILHNLGKLCLHQKQIWLRLLSYICDVVDQAQVIDLSMALSAICRVQKSISKEERQQLFPSKEIISKRLFQLYTSLDAKTIDNLKDLIHNKLIENQLVPVRIRKQVEIQFSKFRIQQQNQDQAHNQQKNQHQNQHHNQHQNQHKNQYQNKNKNQHKNQYKRQGKFVRKQGKNKPQQFQRKYSRPQKQEKNERQE